MTEGKTRFELQKIYREFKDNLARRAVSWKWLLSFVRLEGNTLENLTTQEVVNEIIIPRTKHSMNRYINKLSPSVVNFPTYFVSHVWSALFLDLIASLSHEIKLKESDEESRNVFVWIDIFAINQQKIDGQKFDLATLPRAIVEATKGTLVCVDNKGQLFNR